ncbi:MAG TPA: hypothetical protein VFP55_05295 [Solirubrobacteraceae bacterium]|nr:hypothetical protein [Solirubrobacteraceae bacterium]
MNRETARNVAIVLLLAAIVDVVPAGGSAAGFLIQLISLAFLGAIAWVASRLYREHRTGLYALGDRRRSIVYVAAGVATLTFTASSRLFQTGIGSLVWLVLLAGCAFAVFRVFRSYREY